MTIQDVKHIPVLRVLSLIANGADTNYACEQCGIARRTFDRIMAEHPEYSDDIVDGERAELKGTLQKVRSARLQNINKIVESATNTELTFRERLALDEKLMEIETSLNQQLGIINSQPALPASSPKLPAVIPSGVNRRPGVSKVFKATLELQDDDADAIDGETRELNE